jgi:inner membrane protein involved in colicin E2 resistance
MKEHQLRNVTSNSFNEFWYLKWLISNLEDALSNQKNISSLNAMAKSSYDFALLNQTYL